jgi:hypothetical protein
MYGRPESTQNKGSFIFLAIRHRFNECRPETWQAVCAGGDEEDQTARMEQYANYLDTVETHLLQEIAARSSHFFEAAGIVQDLRSALTRTYQQVVGLRKEV